MAPAQNSPEISEVSSLPDIPVHFCQFQKAAVLLRKNPSSLSRAVHRVEEDMDIILFKRTPEGLRPTQEGELYLQAAGEILSMYDELKEK